MDLQPIDARVQGHGQPSLQLHRPAPIHRGGQLRFEATADGDFLVSGNLDRGLAADFAFTLRRDLAGLKAGDDFCCGLRHDASRQGAVVCPMR